MKIQHIVQMGALFMSVGLSSSLADDPSDTTERRWNDVGIVLTLDRSLKSLCPGAQGRIELATGTWIEAVDHLPPISFNIVDERIGSPGANMDGINSITAGQITIDGHENDLGVAIVFEDSSTREIIEADIVFNSKYDFYCSSMCGKDRYDLQSVATHELGHFFGLPDRIDDPSSSMYIYTEKCDVSKRNLDSQDTEAMESLYSVEDKEPVVTDSSCSIRSSRGGQKPWLLVIILALLIRRK